MYNYKVGNRFKWRKDQCFTESYLNDVYELVQRKNGDYYVKTVYSETGDYADWDDNRYSDSYEKICERINFDLIKIED